MTAWLVVGLGNPGSRYAGTRHNIGVQVVERLAERLGTRLRKVRFLPIDAGEATIDGKRLLLARPQTFVNVSGPPVASLARRCPTDGVSADGPAPMNRGGLYHRWRRPRSPKTRGSSCCHDDGEAARRAPGKRPVPGPPGQAGNPAGQGRDPGTPLRAGRAGPGGRWPDPGGSGRAPGGGTAGPGGPGPSWA